MRQENTSEKSSRFWGLEVQDQGAGRIGCFWSLWEEPVWAFLPTLGGLTPNFDSCSAKRNITPSLTPSSYLCVIGLSIRTPVRLVLATHTTFFSWVSSGKNCFLNWGTSWYTPFAEERYSSTHTSPPAPVTCGRGRGECKSVHQTQASAWRCSLDEVRPHHITILFGHLLPPQAYLSATP